MTLRKNTILILAATIVILFAFVTILSRSILIRGFLNLESQNTQETVLRVVDHLDAKLDTMKSMARDYSAWDDTYEYIMNENKTYIDQNFSMDSTLSNLRLNFFIFIRSNGTMVYSKFVDLNTGRHAAMPAGLISQIQKNPGLWSLKNPSDGFRGLIRFADSTAMFVSSPILTSNDQGPARGALIVGRLLDAQEISRIAQETRTTLEMKKIDDPQLNKEDQAASSDLKEDGQVVVRPFSKDRIAGYSLLKDAFGNPALIVKISTDRRLYRTGLDTILGLLLIQIVGGLVLGALILILLERQILNRLYSLTASIARIRGRNDVTARVPVTGKDELTRLAQAINRMLDNIEECESVHKKAING